MKEGLEVGGPAHGSNLRTGQDQPAHAESGPVRLLGHKTYPVHPWRNGRGVLRHIADGHGWQLRLADITESAPFSDLSGQLRLFAMVEGAVVLEMPDGPQVDCHPDSAVAIFDGGAAPHCRLVDGPAKAFNLMVEPDKVAAGLERRTITGPHAEAAGVGGEVLAIYVQSGRIECRWRSPGADTSATLATDASAAQGRHVLAGVHDTLMPLATEGVLLQASAETGPAVVLIARIRPLA